ncbi:MAG: homoserine kinase [Casimicrobium sp.]
MSVFTRVSDADVVAWLPRFNVGELRALTPISEGIENTNYFLTTSGGEFVLTLYERIPVEDLPFYLNFSAHLSKAGVAVPSPIADRSGALFSILNGKPASLTERVPGRPHLTPSVEDCAQVGAELARMHLASQSFRGRLTNKRGPGWMLATYRRVRNVVSAEQAELINSELAFQRQRREVRVPTGAIHADLFCDNVLFDDGRLSGFIDFGFAATDAYVYDLAITVNDWCVEADGALDAARRNAMLESYGALRRLNESEQLVWPAMLRGGALRFWLSRLDDFHFPRAAELNTPKDPAHFERILRARIDRPDYWPSELSQ